MNIGVVGAGIVGASIAYHLARDGAKVTIFDPHPAGSGVSGSSFACLNAFGRSGEDLAFRLQAIRYHRTLAREIGGEQLLHQCGTLRMTSAGEAAAKLARDAASFAAAGGVIRDVSANEMIALEPRVNAHFAAERFLVAEEGWADSGALCKLLVKTASQRFGARSISEPVLAIEASDSWAKLRWPSNSGTFDRVIFAAGNDTNMLLGLAGLQPLAMGTVPGPLVDLVETDVVTPIRHVVYADEFHIRPGRGSYLAGVSASSAEMSLSERLDHERLLLVSGGTRWIDGFLDMARQWTVCPRPMPVGEHPIVGPLPEHPYFYVAVMHGGITLAPVVGKIVASKILSSSTLPEFIQSRRPMQRATQPGTSL